MKAKQRNRPVEMCDLVVIESALSYLKLARSALREGGANNAAVYVQRALKSAQGAANNADRMYQRQKREAAKPK